MSATIPLLNLDHSRHNSNSSAAVADPISLRERQQEIVQLNSAAKCTYCAAKTLNLFCLPLSMPCHALKYCCELNAKSSHYTDNENGLDYCLATSCKSPCWNPVTQFPNRQMPDTVSDILTREMSDPCGCLCCSPCSDQILTRDFLPKEKSERLRYLEGVDAVLEAYPPPPQHMGAPRIEQPLNSSPDNIRKAMLVTAFRDASNQTLSILHAGPLSIISEYAGPIPAPKKRQVTFHPTPPPSPRVRGLERTGRIFS